jgi:Spy/CpxP family protein refolding chaperone
VIFKTKNTMKLITTLALSMVALSAVSVSAFAQGANNNNNNNNNNRGNRGNFNPGDFTQRIKTSLKATDEEWTVLQPLVENVMAKQRDASGFGGGRGRGPGGGGDNAPTTPAAKASQDLRDLLDKDSATPEEIKAKLAAVRDTKKKAQAELTQAREELRKGLTLRQEAYFVSRGLLE